MKWWGPATEHAIICYACRERVTNDELASGAHDHADKADASAPAPRLSPAPDLGLGR